jgi:hypothetical protein
VAFLDELFPSDLVHLRDDQIRNHTFNLRKASPLIFRQFIEFLIVVAEISHVFLIHGAEKYRVPPEFEIVGFVRLDEIKAGLPVDFKELGFTDRTRLPHFHSRIRTFGPLLRDGLQPVPVLLEGIIDPHQLLDRLLTFAKGGVQLLCRPFQFLCTLFQVFRDLEIGILGRDLSWCFLFFDLSAEKRQTFKNHFITSLTLEADAGCMPNDVDNDCFYFHIFFKGLESPPDCPPQRGRKGYEKVFPFWENFFHIYPYFFHFFSIPLI